MIWRSVATALWRSDDRGATWRRVPLDRNDLIIVSIVDDASGRLVFGAVDAGGFDQGSCTATADAGATWRSSDLSFNSRDPSDRLARLVAHPTEAGSPHGAGDERPATEVHRRRRIMAAYLSDRIHGPGLGAACLSCPTPPDTAILVQSQASHDKRTSQRSTPAPPGRRSARAACPTVPWSSGRCSRCRAACSSSTPTPAPIGAPTVGARWQPLEGALSSGFVHAWAGQASNALAVLAATDYGLFSSSDGGAVWRAYGTGLPANSKVAALLTHKDRPTQIVASLSRPDDADPPELLLTRDNGLNLASGGRRSRVERRDSLGHRPEQPGQSLRGGTGLRRCSAPTADSPGRSIRFQTPTGPPSWSRHPIARVSTSTALLPYAARTAARRGRSLRSHRGRGDEIATGLAVDPADADHLWSGGADGVRESRDGGETWERAGLDGQSVRWLAVSGGGKDQGPLTLYAGLADGGMMRRGCWRQRGSRQTRACPPAASSPPFWPILAPPACYGQHEMAVASTAAAMGATAWVNVGVGVGDNLGLALAVNYQAPGSVLMGTATAGYGPGARPARQARGKRPDWDACERPDKRARLGRTGVRA